MNNDSNAKEPFDALNGGEKRMWIDQNHRLIIDFYQAMGKERTKSAFRLEEVTLDSILNRPIDDSKSIPKNVRALTAALEALSRADVSLTKSEIASCELRDVKRQIEELKNLFNGFQQEVSTQLVDRFFKPLLQNGLKLGSEFIEEKQKDPLSLESINEFLDNQKRK